MLLNAKATLNETMDYNASTCELQPQTLLVCLSSMPVLQQEAEPPVKKYFHIEIFLFFLLIIIFAKLLSYNRAEKKQEYTLKKKKDTLPIGYAIELYCSFMLSLAAPEARAETCPGRGSP